MHWSFSIIIILHYPPLESSIIRKSSLRLQYNGHSSVSTIMPTLPCDKPSGLTEGARFVTSTVGNIVGGLGRTVGGIVGAGGRGLGYTISNATGSAGQPVGDSVSSVGTGIEDGLKRESKMLGR